MTWKLLIPSRRIYTTPKEQDKITKVAKPNL